MENNYTPNTVLHLFETAHSGFYGDNPSATVNLVPKTWTRYTITDGNWMTPKTVEPLELRDIYLANKIDEVDGFLGDLYKPGDHIIIDKETNTISVNPFDYRYVFTNGILNTDYNVYTQLPDQYGGLENKLILKNNKLTYDIIPGNTESGLIPDETISSISSYAGLIEGSIDDFPENTNIVIVTTADYFYDDSYYDCGGWTSGYREYWDEYEERRVVINLTTDPPEPTGAIVSGNVNNAFNPADNRTLNRTAISGGTNYIENIIVPGGAAYKVSMVPDNTLFIYD